MELNLKEMTIKDIGEWCIANEQTEWLKATGAKKVEYKVYPKIKVPKIDKKTGEQARDAKGNLLYTTVSDKTKEPIIEERPISFIQLKTEFIEHFSLGEPKKKKMSMYDYIASL